MNSPNIRWERHVRKFGDVEIEFIREYVINNEQKL